MGGIISIAYNSYAEIFLSPRKKNVPFLTVELLSHQNLITCNCTSLGELYTCTLYTL
jgi:hypothetical protein